MLTPGVVGSMAARRGRRPLSCGVFGSALGSPPGRPACSGAPGWPAAPGGWAGCSTRWTRSTGRARCGRHRTPPSVPSERATTGSGPVRRTRPAACACPRSRKRSRIPARPCAGRAGMPRSADCCTVPENPAGSACCRSTSSSLGAAWRQLLVGGGVSGDEGRGGDGEDGSEGHEPPQPRSSGHGAIVTRNRRESERSVGFTCDPPDIGCFSLVTVLAPVPVASCASATRCGE